MRLGQISCWLRSPVWDHLSGRGASNSLCLDFFLNVRQIPPLPLKATIPGVRSRLLTITVRTHFNEPNCGVLSVLKFVQVNYNMDTKYVYLSQLSLLRAQQEQRELGLRLVR